AHAQAAGQPISGTPLPLSAQGDGVGHRRPGEPRTGIGLVLAGISGTLPGMVSTEPPLLEWPTAARPTILIGRISHVKGHAVQITARDRGNGGSSPPIAESERVNALPEARVG